MICSATHEGFLSRRSKDDIKEGRSAKSLTGPGKPYWNIPAGFTGDVGDSGALGRLPGPGTVFEVVCDSREWVFFGRIQ